MKLFSTEWREQIAIIADMLRPYIKNASMGSARYVNENRCVSVKHRMRKDKEAVDTFGCWFESEPLPTEIWIVTTATPTDETAKQLGQQLLAYLEEDIIPTIKLPTYPGYEDISKDGISA